MNRITIELVQIEKQNWIANDLIRRETVAVDKDILISVSRSRCASVRSNRARASAINIFTR